MTDRELSLIYAMCPNKLLHITSTYLGSDMLNKDINHKIDFSKSKIIFNNQNTVLIGNNGKKYVSITGHGDTYDKEKGVMMCMLKALGYSFTDVSKLLEKAKEQ